jgi:peptide/nickel transport system permease protein
VTLPAFAVRRLAGAAGFVIAVAIAAFVLADLAPGDATTEMQLSGVSAAAIQAERARLDLDAPLTVKLMRWVSGAARGDLGTSAIFRRPVTTLLAERVGATAELAAISLALATAIGLPLGVIGGALPRHWVARVTMPVSLALLATPPLVSALAVLFVGARSGLSSLEPGSLLLPVCALALPVAAALERLEAQAMRDAMSAPDLVATFARGVPRARVIWAHAARQSLRPVLGVYGIVIGSLFGGSLIVEIVTAWPGLGRLTFDALRGRDVYLAAGCALAGAALLAAGNLAADLLRQAADPRARDMR